MIFGHLYLSKLAFLRLSGQIDVYLRSHVPDRVSPVNYGYSKHFLEKALSELVGYTFNPEQKRPSCEGLLEAGEQGFEPRILRPERNVLPLHHSPVFIQRAEFYHAQ